MAELLQPPPRPVRRRRMGPRVRAGCPPGCLLLTFGMIGFPFLVGLVLGLTACLLMECFGSVVNGTVTDLSSFTGIEGERVCSISYSYPIGSATHVQEDAPVAPDGFDRLQKGGPVPVLVGPLMSGYAHRLLVKGSRNPWEQLLLPALLCLVLYGYPGVGWIRARRRAARHCRLVSTGLPAPGTIRDGPHGPGEEKAAQPSAAPEHQADAGGGSTGSRVVYRYQVPGEAEGAAEQTLEGVMDAPEDYAVVPIGGMVTVLYDPADPRQSLIYRFADYEAVLPTSPDEEGEPESDPGMNPILEAALRHVTSGKQIVSIALGDPQFLPVVTFTFADGWRWSLPLHSDPATCEGWWKQARRALQLLGQIRLPDEPKAGPPPAAEDVGPARGHIKLPDDRVTDG